MKKVLGLLVVLCMCVGMVGCGSSGDAGSDTEISSEKDEQIAELKETNVALKKQVEELTNQIADKNDKIAELKEQALSSKEVEAETKQMPVESSPAVDLGGKTYGVGETWTVEGMWNLTFTSATVTEERNQFEETNPAQVLILNYSYENLGYVGEYQDLFISSMDMQFIDGSNQMADTYPLSGEDTAKPAPIGSRCDASEAIGLKNASDKITVIISRTDSNGEAQKATFELPIQ